MKLLRGIRSIFFNLHCLVFTTGFLLAAYLFCRIQDDYENRLFASVAQNVLADANNGSQELQVKKALNTTYYLLRRRSAVFKNEQTGGFLDDYIHPVSSDIITADGACGSYSSVLCRVLNTMGYTTRFAQMTVNGGKGGHIITEVNTSTGWAVLDPLYNLYFTKPDGHMASFDDVSANWKYYQHQVPAGYDPSYNYEGVRYTNWNKIAVVMPALKSGLSMFMSKNALEHLSVRSYFMRKYKVAANVLLMLIIPLCIAIVYKVARVKYMPYLKWQQWQVHSQTAA